MSLSIRYLTNGEKSVFTVRDAGTTPHTFEVFNNRDDISESIRHYAPKGEPVYCGPNLARYFGVLDLFYPNHPNCILEEYADWKCWAESCKYIDTCEVAAGAVWNKKENDNGKATT